MIFVAFYVAGREAGGGSVYDSDRYYSFAAEELAARNEALVYIRPPFYALLFKPLTALDYQQAHYFLDRPEAFCPRNLSFAVYRSCPRGCCAGDQRFRTAGFVAIQWARYRAVTRCRRVGAADAEKSVMAAGWRRAESPVD